MITLIRAASAAAALVAANLSALAEDIDRPAAAVQDNSFLIEEAYNQEARRGAAHIGAAPARA